MQKAPLNLIRGANICEIFGRILEINGLSIKRFGFLENYSVHHGILMQYYKD